MVLAQILSSFGGDAGIGAQASEAFPEGDADLLHQVFDMAVFMPGIVVAESPDGVPVAQQKGGVSFGVGHEFMSVMKSPSIYIVVIFYPKSYGGSEFFFVFNIF